MSVDASSVSGANVNVLALGASGQITTSGGASLRAASQLELNAAAINIANTGINADTLKMRALGANGSLVIDAGSTLSATTQLLLYADGASGSITFQGGNVALNTGSTAGILAAPSITIKTGTVVTVNGSVPIQVYTNNANYDTDYGGNGAQTGTFAGTAAPSSGPQPFVNAPAYPAATPASGTTVPATGRKAVPGKGKGAGNMPSAAPIAAAKPVSTIPAAASRPGRPVARPVSIPVPRLSLPPKASVLENRAASVDRPNRPSMAGALQR